MSALIGTTQGLFILDDPDHPVVDGPVTALTPGATHALVDGRRVLWHDGDGWQPLHELDPSPRGRWVLAVGDGVWVGTAEARILQISDRGATVLDGFERAPGRSGWTTPWGGPPDVRTMASADDRIYVNVHVGGISATDDGGVTWEPLIDIGVDVHQVITGPDGLVLAACGAGGLARSRDHGRTWEHLTEGLHATYCRAVALAGDAVFLTASDGPFTEAGSLYRLGPGDRFEPCEGGLPRWFDGNLDTGVLAAWADMVVLAGPDGSVWVSTDVGATWEQAAKDLPSPTAVAIS
jgi:photosystem II stability/assembly factor-like uncharacterized protein